MYSTFRDILQLTALFTLEVPFNFMIYDLSIGNINSIIDQNKNLISLYRCILQIYFMIYLI